MSNINESVLNDTFELYLTAGQRAEESKQFQIAKKNYLLAAEVLLKLAKNSTPALKEARIARAKKLFDKATNLGKLEVPVAGQEKTENNDIKVQKNEKITLEEALAQLNQLEGLSSVKSQVRDWVDQIKVFQMRRNCGLSIPGMSYHMVFSGNPGTGKTTVARIIAQIYCALGILKEGQLVEVERGDLVAGYIGQTAIKTQEVIKKAIGGVLFIDEAYSLNNGGSNDFGQEAIDTLLKAMEDNRSELVVIVAGYDELMDNFVKSNPGLRSRFKNFIKFDDYNGEELYKIFVNLCAKNEYKISEEVKQVLLNYFNYLYASRDENFGNARDVRNFFEKIITKQSKRVAIIENPSIEQISSIILADLPFDASLYNKPFVKEELTTKTVNEEKSTDEKAVEKENEITPEEAVLKGDASSTENGEYMFDWNSLPIITFDDVAGLKEVKETVEVKVLLPLKNPSAFEGYAKKNGGGLLLYGPPGTGKTMIAAAIANEIGAKFCSVKPSDLLHQGAGNTEKAVRALFSQARKFPCAVIYFDEMDSIAPKDTRSQYAKQLRSELLSQLQGVESYGEESGNILFLVAATNKPWDMDSAFLRPGRFGTRVYVGLPDKEARRYIVDKRFKKIIDKGIVRVNADLDKDAIVDKTEGFNGSDLTNLLDKIEEFSIIRGVRTGEKFICNQDVIDALEEVNSSVQRSDIEKLMTWKADNDS